MSETNFLLYLKALIWSIFVSYSEGTVQLIVDVFRKNQVPAEIPEFKDTHLGDGLRFLLQDLPRQEDRQVMADSLPDVKHSLPSMVYQNMVIEVGHYVVAREDIDDGVLEDCPGVVYCLEGKLIQVLFRKPDKTLAARNVHPFQIMPIYTLKI